MPLHLLLFSPLSGERLGEAQAPVPCDPQGCNIGADTAFGVSEDDYESEWYCTLQDSRQRKKQWRTANRGQLTQHPLPNVLTLMCPMQADNGSIYYLRTETPHLRSISVSGPYHRIEDLAQRMRRDFGSACPSGQTTVDDLLADGRLTGTAHVGASIRNDQNRIKRCRIIAKNDPVMKARLPCPVWYVVLAEPHISSMQRMNADAAIAGNAAVPLTDLGVHGTYASEPEAITAARLAADTLPERMGDAQVRELDVSGDVHERAGFAVFRPPFGKDQLTFVFARHDD